MFLLIVLILLQIHNLKLNVYIYQNTHKLDKVWYYDGLFLVWSFKHRKVSFQNKNKAMNEPIPKKLFLIIENFWNFGVAIVPLCIWPCALLRLGSSLSRLNWSWPFMIVHVLVKPLHHFRKNFEICTGFTPLSQAMARCKNSLNSNGCNKKRNDCSNKKMFGLGYVFRYIFESLRLCPAVGPSVPWLVMFL